MEFKEIQELIKLINKSNLTEFKMKDGDFTLSIRTKKYGRGKTQVIQPQQQILPVQTSVPAVQVQSVAPASAPVSVPQSQPDISPAPDTPKKETAADNTDGLIEVKSPIVGTFYRSASPNDPPYVEINSVVSVGSVVCIVEAMKLFNEIESEVSGKIVKVMIDDASPVEYDQVLFLVDPKG